MSTQVIATEKAPAAIGPYSQAVRVGGLLYTAGQIALDPATMEIVPGGIKEQTTRVLENLKAIVEAAGSTLDQVVKTTVFLQSLADFGPMNEVYATYLGVNAPAPARTTVEVAALPRNALVEIEVVAEVV